MIEPFRFKQFSVRHDQCAMKVGTDGVLLGAWADVTGSERVLDIGTGTGLIALMLAQRQPTSRIDAVEIEPLAQQQANINFAESPWGDRITLQAQSIQDWAKNNPSRYDLIVTNPPFFEIGNHTSATENARRIARSTATLNYTDLLYSVQSLLQPQGYFSLILPSQQARLFIPIAQQYGLFLHRIDKISPRVGFPDNRWLMEFIPTQGITPTIKEWAIRKEGDAPHNYTNDYIDLTKDFYLFIK